jgi:hypothetical protein
MVEKKGRELGEVFLLFIFLIGSSFMFIKSYSFSFRSGIFPRIVAAPVIIGSALVLIVKILPTQVKNFLPGSAINVNDEEDEGDDGSQDIQGIDQIVDVDPKFVPAVFLALFLFSGYLFGLLWVAPIFILGYVKWFYYPWHVALSLSLLGFALGYLFMVILNLPLDQGVIISGEQWS